MTESRIWLQPICEDGCERGWADHDFGPCEDCGLPCVAYVRVDEAERRLVSERAKLDEARSVIGKIPALEEIVKDIATLAYAIGDSIPGLRVQADRVLSLHCANIQESVIEARTILQDREGSAVN